jgi:DHA1 family inner membrane transport protein
MVARVVTSLTHGTFFGVGSVVATSLVPAGPRRPPAIAMMFTGLTHRDPARRSRRRLARPAFRLARDLLGGRRAIGAIGLLPRSPCWFPADKGKSEEKRHLREELATVARPAGAARPRS